MVVLACADMAADRTSSYAWSRALAPTWASLALGAMNVTPMMLSP